MSKITKSIMLHLIWIGFLGLCLGFPSRLYGMQQHSTLEEKAEEASAEPANGTSKLGWHCTSVKDCAAVGCVMGCLAYWQKVNDRHKPESILSYLSSTNHYMHIIDAYHHLVDRHLSTSEQHSDYKYIHDHLHKKLGCDFPSCAIYTRNQRDRGKEAPIKREDGDMSLWKCAACGLKNASSKQLCQACFKQTDRPSDGQMQRTVDKEYIFLRDLLDTIHVYLVHGYDSGHRYVAQEKDMALNQSAQKPKIPAYDTGDNEAQNSLFFDVGLKNLQTWQKALKRQQCTQRRQGKFQTTISRIHKDKEAITISLATLTAKFGKDKAFQQWIAYLHQNECDTDNILSEVDSDTFVIYGNFSLDHIKAYIRKTQTGKSPDHQKNASYGFGIRLYYWPYYKANSSKDNVYHPHLAYKSLYVSPAYRCFKSELLAKDLPIMQWHQKIYEAEKVLSLSSTLKRLKTNGELHNLAATYAIKAYSGLAVHHVLAVCFYTNFTTLSTAFSRSFRYLSPLESEKDVISRNAKWHHLSKYLREVVEIFGEQIGYDAAKAACVDSGSFYHGVSYVLFSNLSVHFCGPLSTSKQLAVATLFTDNDGLVVELKQGEGWQDGYLTFFNVSLLSCFAAEEERLFMGGQLPLQIASIRILKGNINTQPLIHTLSLLRKMITGQGLLGDRTVGDRDFCIFKQLLFASKDLPPYVQQLWDAFRYAPQTITIHMSDMYTHYKLLMPFLYASDPKYKHVLRLDKLIALFPYTKKIICEGTDNITGCWDEKGHSPLVVCSNFVLGLQRALGKLAEDKRHQLQKIVIQTSHYCITKECKLYALQFGVLGWAIGSGRKTIVVTKTPYDHCMGTISTVIRGEASSCESTSLDMAMWDRLVAGSSDVPAEAKKIWRTFRMRPQKIQINPHVMSTYYPDLVPAFFSSSQQCKNLLRFDKIVEIFPNVTEIISEETNWDHHSANYAPAIVETTFILGLQAMLGKIAQDKSNKLEKITIQIYAYKISDGWHLYAGNFGLLGWKISYESEEFAHITERRIVLTKREGAAKLLSSKK